MIIVSFVDVLWDMWRGAGSLCM